MEILRIHGLTAGYGDAPAVLHGVDLDVRRGEVVALLGASGSGKSTLLRCVAGLHPLREGWVALDGSDVQSIPVERRRIGLVFQDHALFPHRDVAGNVAFGPRMQGLDRAEIDERVREALTSVGILRLRDRAIDELSGGEQQRVALARALASHPRLLLLDEPYGSLDRPLRERLIAELPGLVKDAERGAVLVTHDQQEALRAADRIAVLVDGELRQIDTPERLWSDPVDADVAAFLDVGPLVDADIAADVACGMFGEIALPAAPDGPARLLLPRTALEILRADASSAGTASARSAAGGHHDASGPPAPVHDPVRTSVRASLVGVRFSGDHHRIEVALGDGSRVTVRTEHRHDAVDPGALLDLAVATDAVRVFPPAP